MHKKLILDILNVKPFDSIVEKSFNKSLKLNDECKIRRVKYHAFLKKMKISKNTKLLIQIKNKSSLKLLDRFLKDLKNSKFLFKVYLIVNYEEREMSYLKNLFNFLKYFLFFKLKINPIILRSRNNQLSTSKFLMSYPYYLNKNKFESIKFCAKQNIINLYCVLTNQYEMIIYKIK